MAAVAKPYQVVVFGATGFVGNLVCEQLLRDYQGKVKWAAAGRSRAKLEEMQNRLSGQYSGAKSIPLIVADAADTAALESMTEQTQCVLSLSGPYKKYGSKAVAACIKTKTHWCDLTAEVPWIRDMISQHHEEAKAAGVKIINCCGFDSIPADLGAFFMAEHIRNKLDRQPQDHETVLARLTGGGISGGTAASLVGILSTPADEKAQANDPYALDPPGSRRGRDGGDSKAVAYNKPLKQWTFPSAFQTCDNRITRRSSALLGGYGEDYSCKETAGAPGLISAVLITLFLAAFLALLSLPLFRPFLARRVLPQPGQGPSRKAMLSGKNWKVKYVTTAVPKRGGKSADVQTVLGSMTGAQGDPGYWDTATMIIECAICLATQEKDLKAASRLEGGILTTASAFGWVLIERLRARGFGFSIDSPT